MLGKTSGYGSVRWNGKSEYVHRIIFEQANGPIPDHLVVDHECHNRNPSCPRNGSCPHRSCQNPAHMQLVTRGRNRANAPIAGAAAIHAAKSECVNGHALMGDNLKPNKRGARICRKCAKKRNAEYYQRSIGR